MAQKKVAIFRRVGDLPPQDWFAMGCFASGYIPHIMDHSEFDGSEYDAVVVGGQPTRYKGANGIIAAYYRHHGVPVIFVEGGWLYEPHVPRYWFTYLNHVPYCPPFECPDDRRIALNMTAKYKPRGEDIIVVGQMPEADRETARVTRRLKEFTDRKVIYRPRKQFAPEWRQEHDEISEDLPSDKELDRAWCVITHFSFMGGEALMRGIPVICDPGATFAEFGQHSFDEIDDLEPPPEDAVNRWLSRMAYILWSGPELRNGDGFRWLMETAVKRPPVLPR